MAEGATRSQTDKRWHTMDRSRLRERLGYDEDGLTTAEALARLERLGPNRLPEAPPSTWWQIALRQFQNPLIYILLIATVVSVAIGDYTDAGFIVAVLAINTLIGGYQEWRAEQSSRALHQLLRIRAAVMRDGEVAEIDAEQVVPGDVVWLESGGRVPADVRLLSAHGLEVDESLLTGESLAVLKDPEWGGESNAPITGRLNMCHAGTIVIHGRAQGVVVETGTNTAVGQLAVDVMTETGGKPPLLERMERFVHVVAISILAAIVVVILLGITLRGYGWGEMVLFGVALAVSAIPEGLPAALTVALAVATVRMARRNVIVRRLAAVEGLGSCTLIASDKTGTLTCNELTSREVRLATGEIFVVTGEGFVPAGEVRCLDQAVSPADHELLKRLARAAVLCNEADLHLRDHDWIWHGDPTDIALLTLGHKLGLSREAALGHWPQVNQIPFEPERRFAATYHRVDGQVFAVAKGAPERVLGMCQFADRNTRMSELHETAKAMADRGYRVLALASGPAVRDLDPSQTPPEPSGLEFLGFVGMIDPLRHGVREAVASCRQAGITVCMITGDHPVTALAIARDIGLASEEREVVTGQDLEGKSPQELEEIVKQVRVFARVAPRQKLELVRAARQAGHFVAVTGDGVNDAPALRTANIGVAMGKSGTDVAREAAELVISDDNFASIVAGVEEGRIAYDNVRKVIYLLISTGAAEVLVVGLALALGPALALPLLPVQLLWLNLVTNGIQGVALAFEPGEGDVLRRKPRPPSEPIFNRLMIERTIVAAVVMAAVGLGAFWWLLPSADSPDPERQIAVARNVLLLLMVLFENIHIGNCRSETTSSLRLSPLRSPYLLGGAILAFLVHLSSMYFPPLQAVLRTEPVDLQIWIVLIALALTVLVAMEIHKLTWSWRYPTGD